jgi:hypothetical protein
MCYDSRKFGCEFEILRGSVDPIIDGDNVGNIIK